MKRLGQNGGSTGSCLLRASPPFIVDTFARHSGKTLVGMAQRRPLGCLKEPYAILDYSRLAQLPTARPREG